MKVLPQITAAALVAASGLAIINGSGVTEEFKFQAKMSKKRGVTMLTAVSNGDGEADELSLKWSFRRLAPETNYSIIIGSTEQKCGKNFDIEFASEPLATFVTDPQGKASGSTGDVDPDELEAIIATGDLKGRPLALIDDFEQVAVSCGLVKKVKSRRRNRKNRRKDNKREKNTPATSGDPPTLPQVGLDVRPCSADGSESDCGEDFRCAAFNSDPTDFRVVEHFCVPVWHVTCENIYCHQTTEVGHYSLCYQEFNQEAGTPDEVACVTSFGASPAHL